MMTKIIKINTIYKINKEIIKMKINNNNNNNMNKCMNKMKMMISIN
jgi:hypothetical protein